MSRTIEDEFRSLAGMPTLAEAVAALGIIPEALDFAALDVLKDWYRSGAETYLAICRVMTTRGSSTDVVIKACIALTEGLSVEATLAAWIRRRTQLSRHGISTPQLYGHGDGILIEEYIPYTLLDGIIRNPTVESLIAKMVRTAATLARLGYQPTSLFNDLRSRGDDVVLVDFGSDLGPAIPNQYDHTALRLELLNFLASISYDSPDAAVRTFDEETSHS
jgi:hypothetical protein